MKKINIIVLIAASILAVTLTGCNPAGKDVEAKYVFYFIGDGMGFQHITATQAFVAAQNDAKGNAPLSFTNFPVTGVVETFANNRYITGSAAAGTAMSTGHKTSINTIGLSYDHSDTLFSVAHFAKANGFRVGIASSVSIDHATPAAFYAHQPSRNMYHEISHDLISAGFNFYAGGGFRDPDGDKSDNPRGNIFSRGDSLGFLFTSDLRIDQNVLTQFKSVVFSPSVSASSSTLKYKIDSSEEDVALSQITKMGIEVLNNPDGFLFMVEGGKIDWAAHDNDAATVVNEVISLSDAVAMAFEFYNKYPKETLIIVTADHETGGMSVGVKDNKYESCIKLLSNQKHSLEMLNEVIRDFKEQHNGRPTYNQMLDFIASNEVMKLDISELSSKQQEKFKAAYKASVALQTDAQIKKNRDNYGSAEPLAITSMQILNEMASIGWTTFSHTASHVPLYAIGANQDLFSGQIDNTEIPRRIATAMGFSMD